MATLKTPACIAFALLSFCFLAQSAPHDGHSGTLTVVSATNASHAPGIHEEVSVGSDGVHVSPSISREPGNSFTVGEIHGNTAALAGNHGNSTALAGNHGNSTALAGNNGNSTAPAGNHGNSTVLAEGTVNSSSIDAHRHVRSPQCCRLKVLAG